MAASGGTSSKLPVGIFCHDLAGRVCVRDATFLIDVPKQNASLCTCDKPYMTCVGREELASHMFFSFGH